MNAKKVEPQLGTTPTRPERPSLVPVAAAVVGVVVLGVVAMALFQKIISIIISTVVAFAIFGAIAYAIYFFVLRRGRNR